MKKILYGTSALVAAGLLSSSPVLAADPISLSLGGNIAVAFGWVNEDSAVGQPGFNDRDHAFAQSSEVHFNGNTTLDNGVKVTVSFELEGESQADNIDENWLRFSSDAWGTIELGGRDGAASKMVTLGPMVDFNHIVGVAEFTYINFGTNDIQFIAGAGRGSDSYKISYYTPDISGLQIGISYEPEPGIDGQGPTNAVTPDTATAAATGATSENVELGIRYKNTFGDVAFTGSFLYANGSQEGTAAAGEFLDDNTSWNIGVNFSFGAMAIGGSYDAKETNSSVRATREVDNTSYRVAASYMTGAWVLGIGYGNRVQGDETVAGGADEATVWGLTAKRSLGAGVTVSLGLRVWDISDDDGAAAATNDATNVFVATRVGF
jgi:predicted porin